MFSHPPGRKTLSTRATRSRPHSKPLGRTRCSLDAGERMSHEVDGGVANITDDDVLAWGQGDDGCLGHGEDLSNQLLPKKIEAWAPGQ